MDRMMGTGSLYLSDIERAMLDWIEGIRAEFIVGVGGWKGEIYMCFHGPSAGLDV